MADGTGASGTWSINIGGNAATASTASDSSKLNGYNGDSYMGRSAFYVDATSLNQNTYYPVTIWIPSTGLGRIKLANQLDGASKPSWSTHTSGFVCNIDVSIIAGGWGATSPYRYMILQDDYNWSNAKPAYFCGQLGTGSAALFYVRGGGKFYFITDWRGAGYTLHTSSTTVGNQSIAPTTGVPSFADGSLTTIHTNINGNWNGKSTSDFAASSHSHSYVPLSGGTMTGTLRVNNAPIFGYMYGANNNAAAFIWDKNGSNYTGVGACNITDVIHFGPCNANGNWVSNYNQIWRFQGGVYATGWLETDNYGSSAPGSSTPGYGRGGALYFQV